MAIPSRNASPESIVAGQRTFFVSASIAQKRSLLQSDRAAQLFVRILYEYRVQHRYLLHAFVVMPDHFHALLTVSSEMSIERAVQLIKGGFAYRAGRQLQFRAPVWQKGFSEVRIESVEAYEAHRRYIHDNPVRRNLAGNATIYPYSSVNPRFKLDGIPQGLKPSIVCGGGRHG
jgi:putative transposase